MTITYIAEAPNVGRTKRPVDIEHLLHWAFAQTAYVQYHNGSARSLAFNHEYSAVPKGCHSLFSGGDTSVVLLSASADDAKLVLAAVDALDSWTRGIVTRCAKEQNRPDCFVGVEAREVETRVYPHLRKRKGWRRKSHKAIISKRWEPCHPTAICAARDIYERWHAALARLGQTLDGALNDWNVTGFMASPAPWTTSQEKSACKGEISS